MPTTLSCLSYVVNVTISDRTFFFTVSCVRFMHADLVRAGDFGARKYVRPSGKSRLGIAESAETSESSKQIVWGGRMSDSSGDNFWTALPSIMWVGLCAVVLYRYRQNLSDILAHLLLRIRIGAPMKIGAVEIGAIQTAQWHTPAPISESSYIPEGFHDEDPTGLGTRVDPGLNFARQDYYARTRKLMIVHRLFRSTKSDQVYDVLIYLSPHGDGSLASVTRAEYYFGRYWGYKVFESLDRSRGFPVLTSAYGTFLCACRVTFNDGTQEILHRYIDFEMGAYAPVLTAK